MDDRSVAFLEVMAAIAVVGVITFLIFLVSFYRLRSVPGSSGRYQPRWYELILAAVLLVVVAITLLWWLLPGTESATDQDTARNTNFYVVMLIIGGGAVTVFVISLFWRISRGEVATTSTRGSPVSQSETQALAQHPSPSAMRLIGLLGFVAVFLIFNWTYLTPDERFQLMVQMIYPAGLVVALVMLFDKASRAWDVKAQGESAREWLYANAMLGLYLISYVNLSKVADPSSYAAMLWDTANVAGLLLVLWILDRKTSRLRFLLVHAWLIALPILLLIWRSQMGIEVPEDISWWDTVWPFFFLALIFFVVELIIQIATDEGVGISTLKDVVFLVLYVILLLSARPEMVA